VSGAVIGAISDMHGHLPDPGVFDGCDLIAIAGDICIDAGAAKQRAWLADVFAPWLDALPAPAVGIAGNHDFVFQRAAEVGPPELPWTYLQDSGAELAGLTVWGSPWVVDVSGWAFCAPKDDPEGWMADRAALIPD
jgi:predicted phosphohydrolase